MNLGTIPGNTHRVAEGCKQKGKCASSFFLNRSREAALDGKSKELKTSFDVGLLISSQRAHAIVNDWMSGFFDSLRLLQCSRRDLRRLLCISAPLSFRGAEGSAGASHAVISDR